MMTRLWPVLAGIFVATLVSGCGLFGDSGPVRVAIIGNSSQIGDPDTGTMTAAHAILATSVAQGIVSFDSEGRVTAGLAERWTVTNDGLSYIFRMRNADWSDGKAVTTADVATILNQRRVAPRNPISRYTANITSVRAMTAHVIEIRLARPQRDFLSILAQPEMAILKNGRGWGPYRIKRRNMVVELTPVVDQIALEMGDAVAPDDNDRILVAVRPAVRAIARYKNGASDAILGGRFQDWPVVAAANLGNDRIRIDPSAGLFGLQIMRSSGLLSDTRIRMAINTAIHRSRIVAAFNLDGWQPQASLRPFSAALDPTLPLVEPQWASISPEQRKAESRSEITGWKARTGQKPELRIALPDGYGARLLFTYLAADMRDIGVLAVRVGMSETADLRLVDEVAVGDDPIWYLQRLSCWNGVPCNAPSNAKIKQALNETDPAVRNPIILAAEQEMLADPYYIPLASPMRWSVTSNRLSAFRTNMRARHPLNQLRRSPT